MLNRQVSAYPWPAAPKPSAPTTIRQGQQQCKSRTRRESPAKALSVRSPPAHTKWRRCLEKGGELPSSLSFQVPYQGAGGLRAVSVPPGTLFQKMAQDSGGHGTTWNRWRGAASELDRRVLPSSLLCLLFQVFPCWILLQLSDSYFPCRPPLACLQSLRVLSSPIIKHFGNQGLPYQTICGHA